MCCLIAVVFFLINPWSKIVNSSRVDKKYSLEFFSGKRILIFRVEMSKWQKIETQSGLLTARFYNIKM